MLVWAYLLICFTESLESSSIQAAKDVKAADLNEQVVAKLRMQSKSVNQHTHWENVITNVVLSHASMNIGKIFAWNKNIGFVTIIKININVKESAFLKLL